MTASAIYEGTVAHRRRTPVDHRLSYRVFMPLFDLDELPALLDRHPLWSARRAAPVRFRAGDYMHDDEGVGPDGPAELADRARALVADRTGSPAPSGPVRLLTTPRFFGVGFNPVSFYFLHDDADGPAQAVIAEVTNTPWGGRHSYAARRRDGDSGGGPIEASFSKRLHVSPFNPMEQTYVLRAGEPGDSLTVSIANEQDGERIARRRPLAAATRDHPRGDDAPAAHLSARDDHDDSPHLRPRPAAEAQGCSALPKPRGRILGGIGAHGLSGSGIIREVSEQFADVGRGITLCYERYGDPADPPVLLVMGLATQMIAWHPDFCEGIVERGFQVVRFDNRDIGRSTHVHARPPRRARC